MHRQSNFKFTQVVDAGHKATPYRLNLNYGFVPGNELTITAISTYGGERFNVDLVSQSYNNQDVAFHFNPRFNDGVVVRNSQFSSSWGAEERDGGLPIYRNQSFTVKFLCEHDGYRVYINGALFTLFRHRQAPGLISHVNIGGAITVTTMTYQANMTGPGLGPTPMCDIQLQNSFTPGCELTVVGRAQPHMDRFAVNLQCGQGPHVDKLLHWNPRHREGVIVRNSFFNGGWGHEERDGSRVIQAHATFTLLLRCEPEGFKIFVNGRLQTFYIHRQDVHRITHLEITDGVIISSVSYHSRLM